MKALGRDAPIVALPDGDDDKYWHDRASGGWGRYVTGEVIPQVVRKFGADRRRVAIGGISMGGLGAFDLARLHPRRFCAVGGRSPALWRTGGETAPGAFDDAFAAALRAAGAHASVHEWPGGHDGAYWDRHFAAYLRFYARALKRC